MGGVGGLVGAFIYENSVATPNGWVGVLCAVVVSILFSLIGGLIYSVLTITLRVNQNVTGLALTTFGVGFGNFIGGSLSRISGTAGQVKRIYDGTGVQNADTVFKYGTGSSQRYILFIRLSDIFVYNTCRISYMVPF